MVAALLAIALFAPPIASPAIQTEPISCVLAQRHPVIEARVTTAGAVARARLYFRASGTPYWYYVELRPAGEEGRYSAVLPRPTASTAAIEYYAEITARDFEAQRTREQTARVAEGCDGAVTAPMVAAASVSVGSVAAGAPPVPAGFSSAGVLSVTAAAGGGGVPLGLVAGGSAAVVAVAAVVVASGDGEDETCPPSAAAFHEIGLECAALQREARAGCPLGLQVGVGRWPTPTDLQTALAGHRGVITVDGQELPVTNEGATLHTGGGEASGFGDRARATWTASSGTHTVSGYWTIHPNVVSRCTLTVP